MARCSLLVATVLLGSAQSAPAVDGGGRAVGRQQASAPTALHASSTAPSFTIAHDEFVQDGRVVHLRAGCVHYSRVPVEYWEDRLRRLKAMGLNSIQTYVPWNWHEAVQGQFVWEGDRDLGAFLSLAKKVGLLVVVRAGPYMCGEWEFGGLPAFIFQNGSIPIRTYSQPYISYVDAYWAQLLPILKTHLYSNGGNVVMVQCENEYGSYGDVSKHPTDRQYMEHLISSARTALGEAVILFTTDGGNEGYMSRGSIKGSSVYTVGDGCGNPQTCVDAQRSFNAPGQSPFMCSECYTGWLTHWGEGGANTSSSAPHVDEILGKFGGSVSLYMGHGGTNFGWFSGANGGGGSSFQPHITSYDYDSPVSEAGEHGYHAAVDKYAAMQAVLLKHATVEEAAAVRASPEPPLPPRRAFGTQVMTRRAGLLDNLAVLAPRPAATGTMATPALETLGPDCYYGMALYEATLSANEAAPGASLTICAARDGICKAGGLRDRVLVILDGRHVGTLYRTSKDALTVALPGLMDGSKLQLLVENMGRINFSHGMDDERKGIVGDVRIGGKSVTGWTTYCLPLTPDTLGNLEWTPANVTTGPAFFKTSFDVPATADTFLAMKGWTKGSAWINDFNLGRYWETEGPQHTLFVPGPKMRNGTNELVVLELHNASAARDVDFRGEPELRPTAGENSGCDPTVGATAGAHVAMVAEQPKLAHQQAWVHRPAPGHSGQFSIALEAIPTLCLDVAAGCPHPSEGCVTVQACKPGAPSQLFLAKPDPTKPGAVELLVYGNRCLDIFSNGKIDGSALDVWSCDTPREPNQQWKFDGQSYEVIQKHVPFLVTVCTKKPSGGNATM